MAQIDKSAQLHDDDLRCPRCAKRISAETTTCPTCGYEFLPHRARINCKRCGSRIPADSEKCPRCQLDPRADTRPGLTFGLRIIVVVVGVFAIACIGWVIFRAVTTNTLARALGLDQPAAVPTQVVQVIYVLASPVPPISTRTPVPPTPAPTKVVSPTPTKRGAKPAPTVIPPTVIPPGYYPAVVLNAPADTTVYNGINAVVALEWQNITPSGLKENEWYEIQLNFTGRDGKPTERKSYTKEVRWLVSPELYSEIFANARTLKWTVNVVRVDGFDPLASLTRTPITIGSTTRAFIWNP